MTLSQILKHAFLEREKGQEKAKREAQILIGSSLQGDRERKARIVLRKGEREEKHSQGRSCCCRARVSLMQNRALTILSVCRDFSWQKLTLLLSVKLQEKNAYGYGNASLS